MLIEGNKHIRKRNRLKDYDYSSAGAYFVTLCIKNRIHFFGKITKEGMKLNKYGMTAQKYWKEIPDHYKNVQLDVFIILPNHMHGIIYIYEDIPVVTGHCPVTSQESVTDSKYKLLSKIIRAYKEAFVKNLNKQNLASGFEWQRSYYDRIIRDERDLGNVQNYILYNAERHFQEKQDILDYRRYLKTLRKD